MEADVVQDDVVSMQSTHASNRWASIRVLFGEDTGISRGNAANGTRMEARR